MRLALLFALLSACAHTDRGPPYDCFLPVRFEELPERPYGASYACKLVQGWSWPEMQCVVADGGS